MIGKFGMILRNKFFNMNPLDIRQNSLNGMSLPAVPTVLVTAR